MALFGRKATQPNKHHLIDVIEYDGPNDVLVWKHPCEDFNTNSQLIVGHSQEAVFVKGGQIFGPFIPGTHTLSTQNYPFIRNLIGLSTGGVCPFTCRVYFINKAISMDIPWGTNAPISVFDPVYNVPVDVTSYGSLTARVENGKRLLERLVGQTDVFDQDLIMQYFKDVLDTQVRGVISQTIMELKLSVIGIDAHLPAMSRLAEQKLVELFVPYGLALNSFTISSVRSTDLDSLKNKSRALREHGMETATKAEDIRILTEGKAYENKVLQVSEQDKMISEIGKALAVNRGPEFQGGMPMGGFGNTNVVSSPARRSADIASLLSKSGQSAPSAEKLTFEQRVERLEMLKSKGWISQEDFDAKVRAMLEEI